MGAGAESAGASPLVGVSSCLLGEAVRYDGGHKYHLPIAETLGRHLRLLPLCPEVAIGLGVPRPPIHLRRRGDEIRVVGVADPARDVTDALDAYGRRVGAEHPRLCGYLFKKGSPSCGVAGVPVHDGQGTQVASAGGWYSRALTHALPSLPVEEEAGLADPLRWDSFLERVFVLHRWHRLGAGLTPAALADFHDAHALTLHAHGAGHYRALGRILADLSADAVAAVAGRYLRAFMEALARPATRDGHGEALGQALALVRERLAGDDAVALEQTIAAYRGARVPLSVPVTLLRHRLRRRPDPWLARQAYLHPEPGELILRYCRG